MCVECINIAGAQCLMAKYQTPFSRGNMQYI